MVRANGWCSQAVGSDSRNGNIHMSEQHVCQHGRPDHLASARGESVVDALKANAPHVSRSLPL